MISLSLVPMKMSLIKIQEASDSVSFGKYLLHKLQYIKKSTFCTWNIEFIAFVLHFVWYSIAILPTALHICKNYEIQLNWISIPVEPQPYRAIHIRSLLLAIKGFCCYCCYHYVFIFHRLNRTVPIQFEMICFVTNAISSFSDFNQQNQKKEEKKSNIKKKTTTKVSVFRVFCHRLLNIVFGYGIWYKLWRRQI